MRRLVDAFTDLVLGSVCLGCAEPGVLVCPACVARLAVAEAFPVRPDPAPPQLVAGMAATEYAGLARALILRHKERRCFGLAAPLGQLLAVALRGLRTNWPVGVVPVLVPVPSRPEVVRSRGHDPLLRIMRAAAQHDLGAEGPRPVLVPALRQRVRIRDQRGLGAAERAENLPESFAVRPAALRQLARIGAPVAAIVCDDVITTGATVAEAQRALAAVGIPVAGFAVVAATRLRRAR